MSLVKKMQVIGIKKQREMARDYPDRVKPSSFYWILGASCISKIPTMCSFQTIIGPNQPIPPLPET